MPSDSNPETNQPFKHETNCRAENTAGGASSGVEPQYIKSVRFWHERASRLGDGYVGRVNESWQAQQQNIEKLLNRKLQGKFYTDVMDFGCGWGRLIPCLNKYSGHIWAVDVIDSMLTRAGELDGNITTILPQKDGSLSFPSSYIDCVVIVSVLHYWTDDALFKYCTSELSRVVKSGGRVIIIDNAVDKDYHVKPRTDKELAESVCLAEGWRSEKVTINRRPSDHWLIDGVRK